MMQAHVFAEVWRGSLVALDTVGTLRTPVCACVRTHRNIERSICNRVPVNGLV